MVGSLDEHGSGAETLLPHLEDRARRVQGVADDLILVEEVRATTLAAEGGAG